MFIFYWNWTSRAYYLFCRMYLINISPRILVPSLLRVHTGSRYRSILEIDPICPEFLEPSSTKVSTVFSPFCRASMRKSWRTSSFSTPEALFRAWTNSRSNESVSRTSNLLPGSRSTRRRFNRSSEELHRGIRTRNCLWNSGISGWPVSSR